MTPRDWILPGLLFALAGVLFGASWWLKQQEAQP